MITEIKEIARKMTPKKSYRWIFRRGSFFYHQIFFDEKHVRRKDGTDSADIAFRKETHRHFLQVRSQFFPKVGKDFKPG